MSLKVEHLEHNMAKLTIEVPEDKLDAAIRQASERQDLPARIP